MSIEKIKKIATETLKENDVEFAALFGSYARGEETDASDVDFLIRFSKPKSLLDHIGLEQLLEERLKKKVDLVTERSVSKYMKDSIMRDLKPLYGKQSR